MHLSFVLRDELRVVQEEVGVGGRSAEWRAGFYAWCDESRGAALE